MIQSTTSASAAAVDIGGVLDHGQWSSYQKLLTLLAASAVIFDGFDIQILGFAIPSIMREWHLARAQFGPVLAIGLAGMAVGSPLAGYFGDRFGRRIALIGSVVLFGAATMATAFSHNLIELAFLRFITGMGAGGALPNAGALAAEFAPIRWRPVAVTLTIVCVPLGGMIGGLAAARILPAMGWQALYAVGGIAPLALGAALLWALPESPRYLARRPNRWNELVSLLRRMGHQVSPGARFEDPVERAAESRTAFKSLLGGEYLRDTLGLWFAFFCCLSAVYLVFGWLPAMLTAQGLDLATASSGLAAYNFGGVLGVLIWAAVVSMMGSRGPLLVGALGGAVSALVLQFVHLRPGGGHVVLIAAFGYTVRAGCAHLSHESPIIRGCRVGGGRSTRRHIEFVCRRIRHSSRPRTLLQMAGCLHDLFFDWAGCSRQALSGKSKTRQLTWNQCSPCSAV